MERTIVVSLDTEYFEFDYEDENVDNEDELYESAVDYLFSKLCHRYHLLSQPHCHGMRIKHIAMIYIIPCHFDAAKNPLSTIYRTLEEKASCFFILADLCSGIDLKLFQLHITFSFLYYYHTILPISCQFFF